jgi:predicted kinase
MQLPENLLVVFFGMIATGKSYLASAWAREHGLPYYNSDRLRKELAGMDAHTGQGEKHGQGIYSVQFSRRTYDALIERAATHFAKDSRACVVLDGSYQAAAERDLLRQHFHGQQSLVFVHCSCDEAIVRKRLAIRAADPHAVSDGTWEIYLVQKQGFQSAQGEKGLIEIDTDSPVKELVKRVTTAICANQTEE